MLPGSGGFLGGFNADVLNAQPSNEESRVKLVEEIKNRAKTCIATRNFPEAVALYTKGIELTASDAPAQAILHANRSMCHLNMSKGSEALVDADEAVRLDATYIKGYYRLAMAHSLLHQHQHAKEALERGLARKPDDKELAAQLVKVQEKLQAEKATATESANNNNKPAAVPRAATTVSTKSGASSSTAPPSSSSSASSSLKTKAEKEVVDEDEDLKNLNVRGYKKTADGKVTTFFNNEMDEQTKALIGNIAPKKIDAQGEVITTNVAPNSGSAWNAAGTYEEKILTVWATDYLRTQFTGLSATVEAAEVHPQVRAALPNLAQLQIELSVTEEINGHAQVTMLRGKKKHVCDYTLSLKWNILATFSDAEKSPLSVQGTVSVLDITADKEFEVDQIAVTTLNEASATLYTLPKEVALLVSKYVKESDRGVQRLILGALNAFWDELKTK